MNIELNTIHSDFDINTGLCWICPEVGVIPSKDSQPDKMVAVLTQLNFDYCDDFKLFSSMESRDDGMTWPEPEIQENLAKNISENIQEKFCNIALGWNKKYEKLIMFGTTLEYHNGRREHGVFYPEHLSLTIYDEAESKWQPYQYVSGIDKHFDETVYAIRPESWVECEDGTILLSAYICQEDIAPFAWVTVLRIGFDGQKAEILEVGDKLTTDQPRGLCEPCLIKYNNRYYLTIRNDETGYVTVSDDGLHFEEIKPWTFDDGSWLGNYNTKQEWLTIGGKLYLVYTRKADDNANVFRHRAPLFIAEVDPEKLCIIRQTEKAVVPNRGARLGNFGVCHVSDELAFISVAEWMQHDEAGKAGAEHCMKYGSDNSVFMARIHP